jgi:phosphatidylserine decarboxylase
VPTPISEWKPKVKAHYDSVNWATWSHGEFLRDPCRCQRIDSRYAFSPADGIIIAQTRVNPDSDLIETKGTHCTLKELLDPWKIDTPCLVVSIFLTALDVHIVRCPIGAIMSHQHVGPRVSANLPMLFEEKELCEKGRISKPDQRYMASNARVLCRFRSTNLRYQMFLVLLADSDVSAVMPFDPRKHAPLAQSERCFAVRWGSQATLILPLTSRYRFKTLCKVTDHVEAGVDPLVEIIRKT